MRQVSREVFNALLQDVQRFAMSAHVDVKSWKEWDCNEPEKAPHPRIRYYKVGYRWDGFMHLMFIQHWPLTPESTYFVEHDEIVMFKARIAYAAT
jgi:hypothetical protein